MKEVWTGRRVTFNNSHVRHRQKYLHVTCFMRINIGFEIGCDCSLHPY